MNAKGGVGKTTYCNHLGTMMTMDKKDFIVMDLDDQNYTAFNIMKYANVHKGSIVKDEQIDKALLDNFYLAAKNNDFKTMICDCGATTSDQWLVYLNTMGEDWFDIIDLYELNLELHIVVSGGGGYRNSMEFAQKVVKAVNNKAEIVIIKNMKESYSQAESKAIDSFVKANNIKLIEFRLTSDTGAKVMDDLIECTAKGIPFDQCSSPMTKLRYTKELKIFRKEFEK